MPRPEDSETGDSDSDASHGSLDPANDGPSSGSDPDSASDSDSTSDSDSDSASDSDSDSRSDVELDPETDGDSDEESSHESRDGEARDDYDPRVEIDHRAARSKRSKKAVVPVGKKRKSNDQPGSSSGGLSAEKERIIPIHSLRQISSDRQSVYKLPMTKEQEDTANEFFKEYIARDFLGLAKKKEQEDAELTRARARAARRRREMLALMAAPYTVIREYYRKKKEEFRLYRKGKRKVTKARRKRFFLFCAEKQVSMIRKYIKSGHPVNDRDAEGRTGMHHAAAEGHAAVIRELLKRGGEVDPKEYTRNVTPFWYAALVGDISSGEMLIDARCDVDACDALNRHTPLMLCAIGNHLTFAERLIEEGAFLTMQDEIGMTPLHHGKARK